MIIFQKFLIIYIMLAASVLLHELAHFIAAKIFKIRNIDVYIGEKFFAINIKRFHISPLILGGYNEFDLDSLLCISKKKIILFYLSGSFANLLIVIISLFLLGKTQYSIYAVCINIFYLINNWLPIPILHNDFSECISAIKKKKEIETIQDKQ